MIFFLSWHSSRLASKLCCVTYIHTLTGNHRATKLIKEKKNLTLHLGLICYVVLSLTHSLIHSFLAIKLCFTNFSSLHLTNNNKARKLIKIILWKFSNLFCNESPDLVCLFFQIAKRHIIKICRFICTTNIFSSFWHKKMKKKKKKKFKWIAVFYL